MRSVKVLSLIFSVFLISCSLFEKEEKRVFGDDTLSFYMNGELWQSSSNNGSPGLFGSADGCSIGYGTYSEAIEISSYENDDNMPTIKMGLKTPEVDNPYYFTFQEDTLNHEISYHNYAFNFIRLRKIIGYKNVKAYQCKGHSAFVELTRYEIGVDSNGQAYQHIEGRFEATLYNTKDTNDVIFIEDGYFNN